MTTKTQFFTGCTSSDEIKAKYHDLAKANHPDLGGNTATMQQINAEYAEVINAALRGEYPGRTADEYADMANIAEVVRQAVEAVINLPDLTIEICGSWVWLSGNTYAVKDSIKSAGYRWAPVKKLWYFAGVPASSRGKMDMDDIRNAHGSRVVKGQLTRSLAAG